MTTNGAVPAVPYGVDPLGTKIFHWDFGARVELPLVPLDRRGRRYVEVYHGDSILTSGRVDFDDLPAREKLAVHCAKGDEAAMLTWLGRFVEVAVALKAPTAQTELRVLDARQLAQVMPERVEWWWKPLLPVGRPVIVEGDPGVGKSNVIMKICAHVTMGTPFPPVLLGMPPQPAFTPRNVCMLAAEDDAADTLRPRLEANKGDASRLFLLDGWRHPDGSRGALTLQELRLLEQALDRYKSALLVVDPIQAYFGRGANLNYAHETRPILADMAALCKEKRCTVIYVRHLSKGHREQAIYAGLGSIDIAAHVRSALLVGVDPDDPTRRVLAHHKASNAPQGESLAFLLTPVEHEVFLADDSSVMIEASRVDWGGLSQFTASELLVPRGTDDEQEDKSAIEQAKAFLQELLAEGPLLATQVSEAAKAAEVERRTLRRARAQLGLLIRRRKQEGPSSQWPWEWQLSGHREDASR